MANDKAPVAVAALPIDELRQQIEVMKLEIYDLQKELGELKSREARHWNQTENFLAKFGTYYDTTRKQQALFIVGQFSNGGGVNGLALTPQQGVIEQFALPMVLSLKEAEKKEYVNTPIMIPFLIPEKAEEELLELFGAESDGADNKASK